MPMLQLQLKLMLMLKPKLVSERPQHLASLCDE